MTSLLDAQGVAIPGRLHRTHFAAEAGTLTALIGPNGSGKTSLLHALAGIGQAEGEVKIGGACLAGAGPAARPGLVAYLPASREIHWPLSARDIVALGGGAPDQVDNALRQLDLAATADRRVDRLSTGERGRVQIARALASRPALLLLDEPIANLDPLWQLRLMMLLRDELKGASRAAIVAMHDLDAAARFADRLVVMREGRIVADGAPATIMGSGAIRDVFGIERGADGWRPAPLIPSVDR